MTTDNFSTVRATWDVVLSYLVQDADNHTQDEVVASFMHYQHCYVFMKGLAVAQGIDFDAFHPVNELRTKDGIKMYRTVTRDVYIGASND